MRKKSQLKRKRRKRKKVNIRGSELIKQTVERMCLRRSVEVPQWNRNCFYAIIVVLISSLLIGNSACSDSNNNYNSENYANIQRKIPASGSGGGTYEKRSSYAVLSQAMSETITNEFGSEYRSS